MDLSILHMAIAAVAPIHGVSVGSESDRATWHIDFMPDATVEHRDLAKSVVNSFDINAVPVPQSVSAMQAKVALSRAGLLTNVQTWIESQNPEMKLIWNTAISFSRNSETLNAAASALGLTSAQIDALFTAAETINP